jgi:DNA-binding NtrC family response regulator
LAAQLHPSFRPRTFGTGIAVPSERRETRRGRRAPRRTTFEAWQELMSSLWIIHREPQFRAALARLAAAGEAAVLAAPGDSQLEGAAPADVVLLGLAGDFEVELQFAHRFASRLPGARWILLPEHCDVDRARALFDTFDTAVLAYPPDPRALRGMIHAPFHPGGDPLPLSQRPSRDVLSNRFARWFADLELPELLRVLDPHLSDVSLLICGEPGTGRGLLARYVHTFGDTVIGALVHVVCTQDSSAENLLEAIAAEGRRQPKAPATCTLWLEDVDRLPVTTQRQVQAWIEYALPAGILQAGALRWIGTAGDDEAALASGLRQALGAFSLRIPPVRERPHLIAPFVGDTIHAWCSGRGGRPRRFGEDAMTVLEEYPWPGNLRELESTVLQTLLASSADPVRADDLQHEGVAFAPLSAADVGALLEEADTEAPAQIPAQELPDEPIRIEIDEPTESTPPPVQGEKEEATDAELRRLVGAVAHEVRNPLTTIRTFAELLPARYQDGEFRERFAELVGRGIERIEEVVQELVRLAALAAPKTEPIDIASLIEELLERQRERIRERRLLVLKELDKSQPLALGDDEQLRFAFEALLQKCLDIVPERGDVYFASRYHEAGLRGMPSVRVLVRFRGPEGETTAAPVPGVSPAENALEFVVAEAVARAQGGALAIQAGEGDETVLVLDLPAPLA